MDSDGFFNADDLRELFRQERTPIKERDLQLIIERYNTRPTREGRVTYSEFLAEIRPRFFIEDQ